jgi:superfamily II helicase
MIEKLERGCRLADWIDDEYTLIKDFHKYCLITCYAWSCWLGSKITLEPIHKQVHKQWVRQHCALMISNGMMHFLRNFFIEIVHSLQVLRMASKDKDKGKRKQDIDQESTSETEISTFTDFPLHSSLQKSLSTHNFTTPTPIQSQVIPLALQSKDIIGLAQTGSGKTLSFVIPILQSLLTTDDPRPFWAFVLAPTRELAVQIHEVVKTLAEGCGIRSCVLVGGMDVVTQAVVLGKNPHVVIATPGRLMEHLEKTKGFGVGNARFLVSDFSY